MTYPGSKVQYASFDSAGGGDLELVAAVAARSILLLSGLVVGTGGVNSVRFEDGAGGAALTGVLGVLDDAPLVLPFNGGGWFICSVNTALSLEITTATAVAGCITYRLTD